MKRIFPLGVLLVSSLLGACSILPEREELDVYVLPTSNPPSRVQVKAVDWSLRVSRPQASQTLDSTRIAVAPAGDRLSAYKGARWSDRAPVLVRDRLVDAFLADGRVGEVSSDDSRLQADLELTGDLRAFQSEYRSGTPEAHVLLDARLVQSGTRRIVASQRFEVRQPAAGTSPEQVVTAFGKASDMLSIKVLEWTLAKGRGITESK
ncbi:ABC-type transport auxiliary lipoprotein family protein [Pseudomonas boanensis]|uniref:ABC-type transport auxiliary lipoprotein family protein n=1 Tax=Metapseudomonas boanensis TaxID=2822138 RepID=UPI0035D3EC0B